MKSGFLRNIAGMICLTAPLLSSPGGYAVHGSGTRSAGSSGTAKNYSAEGNRFLADEALDRRHEWKLGAGRARRLSVQSGAGSAPRAAWLLSLQLAGRLRPHTPQRQSVAMSAPRPTGPTPEPQSTDADNRKPRCQCGRVALEGGEYCRPCVSRFCRDFVEPIDANQINRDGEAK